MMESLKVLLHVKGKAPAALFEPARATFQRLPCVGEHVATGTGSAWYRVTAVVHCSFPEADCVAEVYAVEEDRAASVVVGAGAQQ